MTGRKCKERVPFRAKIINYLFEGSKLMATVEEVVAGITEVSTVLTNVDNKLDEIRVFIEGLQTGGSGATPEQLTEILNLVNSAKAQADAVLTETDALDE
jgi:hypothetical protein